MAVMNGIDRFHLAMAALTRLPKLGLAGEQVIQRCRQTLDEHARYVREYGEDMPLVSEWRWPYSTAAATGD
jgi:xylulose-5-phosphate/fructose-6-phosphate phosphoketolase